MKRHALLLASALALIVAGLLAGATLDRAGAQDDQVTVANHPLVGTWIVDDPADPADAPSLTVATDSGTVIDFSPAGPSAAGSWMVTGPQSAAATFVYVHEDDNEVFRGSVVIRATIELSGEDAFEARYTYTAVTPTGTVVETRDGVVRGVRVPVEPLEEGGHPLAVVPVVPSSATPTD